MHQDVVDLREFYDSSLGRMANLMIRRRVRELWPNVGGLDLLGVGYTSPFLTPFRSEATRVLNVMPAAQGVVHWPSRNKNLAMLADEYSLPLCDNAMDRVLLVHELESAGDTSELMREIWRVLAPGGRLIIIVPNRHGVWARFDRTPFGNGRPFSRTQLLSLLKNHQFALEHCERALFFPPFSWRFLVKGAGAWERVGSRIGSLHGGVMIAEATKRIYGLAHEKRRRLPRPVAVLRPVPSGVASVKSPHVTQLTRPSAQTL